MIIDGKNFREIQCNCWSADERVRECDNTGVDVQPQHTLDLARYLNDHIAQVCAEDPKRFVGLGTLPMQSPELAVQELKRCVNELGLVGIQIGSHINEWNLDSPELDPIWEIKYNFREQACDQLKVPVFVHPEYMDRIYVDSLVHDEDTLQFLIKKIGIDKVMLGSDYPFPLGESHPGKLIEGCDWLSDEDKEKLL
ncbi:3497_t:CDS:2, partial [Racocetra fulgida]